MKALLWRSAERIRVLFATVAAILFLFQVALVAVAASFDIEYFERLGSVTPPFMQRAFGAALASFAGMTALGFFEPLVIMLLVQFAIYAATEPAGDVDSRLVDLIVARPVPRHWVISRSLVVLCVCTTVPPLVMVGGLFGALALLAPAGAAWPRIPTILLLAMYLTVLSWSVGAAGLAVAARARRRGAALGIIGVSAVALYLVEIVGEAWPAASWMTKISPFHYFHGAEILGGTATPLLDLPVLLALGLAAVAIAYREFGRRDL